jgi:hypothetical protein
MMFVRVRIMRMSGVIFVSMSWLDCLLFRGEDVNLGAGQSSAAYLAHIETRAHIECGGGFFKTTKRNASVDQSAQQHVAAYAGKTLDISNTHRVVILNGRRAVRLMPRAW